MMVKTQHLVLKTQGDVQEDARQEGEADVDLAFLKVCSLWKLVGL